MLDARGEVVVQAVQLAGVVRDTVRSMSAGSRPTRAHHWSRTAFLAAQCSSGLKVFHMSAYWATNRRVTFSPAPPRSTGSSPTGGVTSRGSRARIRCSDASSCRSRSPGVP
ncbi:hypothetical protein SAMN04488546_2955 [Geodermatophilus poikilotrophus]|uniref:Uncharacterized protein n=1 Tax=Geodermatophilus poikilotrophus TaxID=1333667 RepID=A0A1I0FR14_9ACTN|nr:hypothetical protein [Geodermatophilus poikilotrophus]SET60614.1 hypothetical protein SAMN04488546_2955 [Geodermatophilus poikilotrophus]